MSDASTEQLFILSRGRAGNIESAVLTVDAVINETIGVNSTVTDHPVERGSNMTDHSRPEPITIQAECTVSETPLSIADYQRAIGGANFLAGVNPDVIQQVPGYAKRIYDQLKKLRDQGAQLVVISTLGRFESMVIQSLSFPRNAKNYNALQFSVNFKEVRIVENKLTQIKISRDLRPKKIDKKGSAPQKMPTAEEQAALNDSFAYKHEKGFLNYFGGG